MRNRTAWVVVALGFFVGGGSASAGATKWECKFKGTYVDAGDKEKHQFSWSVTWLEEANGDGKLEGTTKDGDLVSTTKGSCKDHACTIDESRSDGEKFYWTGKYTDQETNDDDVYMTSFKGTWGHSASDRKTGGTWEAKANCNRK